LALILTIETATKNCAVGLSENGKTIASKALNDGQYAHAEKLHSFIREVLEKSQHPFTALDAVAVSKGPGSYTGLRIGVSAAKGLCFALDIPLIAVPTLDSLAASLHVEKGYVIPLLDARRMEVYYSVYKDGHCLEEVAAKVITAGSFANYLEKDLVYFLGDGAAKCEELIQHKQAVFIADRFPSAAEMSGIAHAKYVAKDFEDTAYFEPFYLKDFVATKPKNSPA